ncbi:protease Do-like 10, mitochondrial isoform X1 [Eucalyptus grandis]|uniref:protease Do-like 10, mitochondrial isoform X1 n=1 Tax=Eucalyptus grandis TaxID=71139 RepID=UPI00192E7D9A|nr:protease Do-like 10, mitochondrial isoform X1 [Eucalyptus grandis]
MASRFVKPPVSDGDPGYRRKSLPFPSLPKNDFAFRVAKAASNNLGGFPTSPSFSSISSGDGSAPNSEIETELDSVVKIFTVSSSPGYLLPWQNKPPREARGSGFVISGNRIITSAHVVADHTFIQVRKPGSATKYNAHVLSVAHECDLAILGVDSQEFWVGMRFLTLGDIPFLQDEIAVVGYPRGGDNISITKGIVSRVELLQYSHGATQLMAIQIDAAINPGNSGGPALIGGKVVGVAFQSLTSSENTGYIIPVPVIKRFISDVEDNGEYSGLCSLGLHYQPTENSQLRDYFKMPPKMTGVLVNSIHPLSDAYRILKKDDIILAFDNRPVANDGTTPFRKRERIAFDHWVSMKKPNDPVPIKVFREKKECEFSITLRPLQPLVPVHQFDKHPSYYIFAGLIFIPLTQPYLDEYADRYSMWPRRLCERALEELPRNAGQEIVIISKVLTADINAGYEHLAELQVRKVNGTEIENLSHLYRLVEDCTDESIRFDLDNEGVIVFNYPMAKTATTTILMRHRIPSTASADLIVEQDSKKDVTEA